MGRFEHLGRPKLSKFWPFIVSAIVSLSDADLIEFLYIRNNQFLWPSIMKTQYRAPFSYLPQTSEYFVPGTEAFQISIDLQINRTNYISENQTGFQEIDS